MGRLVLIKSVHLCLQNPFSGLGVNARTSTLSVPAAPTDDTFWAVSFAPRHPALPRLLWPTPISPIPCSAQRDSTTPKTEKNGGFPHPEERVRLCPRQAAGARGGKGGDRGPGTPKATKAQTQCCHSRGRAVGPGPSCPDTIGAAPRATCVHCAPAAPPPPTAPPFCPPSDNGSALCARLDKDFVSEKETVFVCQKRSAKKGTGRSGRQRPSLLPAALALCSPAPAAAVPSAPGRGPHRDVDTTHCAHLFPPCKAQTASSNPNQQPSNGAAERVRISPAPPGAPTPFLRMGSAQPPWDGCPHCITPRQCCRMGAQPPIITATKQRVILAPIGASPIGSVLPRFRADVPTCGTSE